MPKERIIVNVAIGCDHRGFYLKHKVIDYMREIGYEYQDYGCYNTDSVDYPDIALKVSKGLSSGNAEVGI